MNTNGTSFWSVVFVLAGFCAIFLMLLYEPTASVAMLDYKKMLLGGYGLFIAGPLWTAYARLNSLDSLDGLRPAQSKIVRDFALNAKQVLLRYFVAFVCVLVLVIVAGLLAKVIPKYSAPILGVAVATPIVFFVLAVVRIVEILCRVERTIRSVGSWKSEQLERSKEVEELKKARAEGRLVPDAKLLNFRVIVNSNDSDAIDAAKQGSEHEVPPPVHQ